MKYAAPRARPALGFVIVVMLASAFVCGLASAPRARAQSDDAATTAAARSLAIEGMKLAQAGDCSAATDRLERAEALHHSAIVLEQLAQCNIEAGRVVLGTEQLRAVLQEPEPVQASKALIQARKRAQSSLEAQAPRISSLTINVNAPLGAKPSVSIDGQPMPAALIGIARPTDPGAHLIEVRAPFFITARGAVTLAAGEQQNVSFELQPAPELEPAETAPSQPEPLPSRMSEPAARSNTIETRIEARPRANEARERTAAYVAFGVGAVALATGLGFGLAAWQERGELGKLCPAHRCPPELSDRLTTARTFGTIASFGFATSVVAAALGTFLFFDSAASERGSAHAHATPRVTLAAGIARAEFSVRFE